jgi:hypothetical protein
LKKSTPAQSGSAPFPISCTADVAAPPDAERFDVAAFTLVAHLQARALDATPAAVAAAVAVEVVSADLPRALRGAIAARLHATWAAADPGALLACWRPCPAAAPTDPQLLLSARCTPISFYPPRRHVRAPFLQLLGGWLWRCCGSRLGASTPPC